MTKNIMIVGVGGKAALSAGLDVKISEVHGMAQRGGSVVTFVRFGDKVCEPVVEEGQADVIIAFERLEALRYAHFLKKDGTLVVNDARIDPMTVVIGAKEYPENILEKLLQNHELHAIDGQKLALELGNSKVLKSVVLGFAASFIGFSKELWLDTVASTVPPKTVEINKKAFELGYIHNQE